MDVNYLILMAFHIFGALFNVRMLVSCFKGKKEYIILQKSRPFLILECILQLTVLSLSAEQSMKAFSLEYQNCCSTSSVLMISSGFLLIYNLLAILSIEYNIILFIKTETIVATLLAGFITSNIVLRIGCFTADAEEQCVFQIASAIACILLLAALLLVAKRIYCRYIFHAKSNQSTLTSLLFNFLTVLFLLCFVLIIIMEVVRHGRATTYQLFHFEEGAEFFERVFYLYVLCTAVGFALPLMFQHVIESSRHITDEADDAAKLVTDSMTITSTPA